jgi:TolB-like protein/DNA-binding winged helix-turn-helix (wHTH) protein/Flp pilus assembly protein TadD
VKEITKGHAAACYRSKDVVIDCRDFSVLKNGERQSLTPRAFDVLRYLVERHDRVVEKSEIFEQVWKEKFVTDNALTRVVAEIRQALGDSADSPQFVETAPKRGYRFIGPVEEQPIQPPIDEAEIESSREAGAEEESRLPAQLNPPPLTSPMRPHSLVFLIAALIIMTSVAGALIWRGSFSHATETPSGPISSVAVLPLRNLSNDPANEYFSDGLTDSLITALSKVEGLEVRSFSSVRRFKNQEVDPQTVGKQLNVAAALEGGVRKDGESVRVTVRLVSAADGRILWVRDTYDRDLKDIFALQDEIASQVVTGLRLKLSGESRQQLTKRYTENIEAYNLYLKGRFQLDQRERWEIRKSAQYFQQAINLDSNYARAYAGLAEYYFYVAFFGDYRPADVMPKAKEAAERALELDDALAEAHVSMGLVHDYYDWDWSKAEREFKRAVELNPNSPHARRHYGLHLEIVNRRDEMYAENRQAMMLDPLDPGLKRDLGWMLIGDRKYDQAVEWLGKAIEADQNFASAYGWQGVAYEAMGSYDQAFVADLKHMILSGLNLKAAEALEKAYTTSGWKGYLRAWLSQRTEIAKRRYTDPSGFALLYARLGAKEQAIEWLEKCYVDRCRGMVGLRHHFYDNFRSDPRFQDLVRRVGLPE